MISLHSMISFLGQFRTELQPYPYRNSKPYKIHPLKLITHNYVLLAQDKYKFAAYLEVSNSDRIAKNLKLTFFLVAKASQY